MPRDIATQKKRGGIRTQSSEGASKKSGEGECTIERVAKCFQLAHDSSAEMTKQKKKVVNFWKEFPFTLASCVGSVAVLVLKEVRQLPKDVLRRHYIFLEMVARSCSKEKVDEGREAHRGEEESPVFAVEKDQVAIETIKVVMNFHNANDKLVRLGVVTVIERLLKAVDQENATDGRQDLYQRIADLLKYRLHDRCPNVRERSVSAIAAFQTGKRDCDVTQQLIALLCTDTSADVRQQILRCIVARKEFLEGYFHGMTRCTGDVIARVRAEAWDALGRFPWRYITAYGSAKKVHLALLIYRGLKDPNSSVVIACSSAMNNSWLHRDCKGDSTLFLDPIVSGYAFESIEPYDLISEAIFWSCKRHNSNFRFPLALDNLHTSALLVWKAECKAASEAEGEDLGNEVPSSLIPLERFSQLFEDAVYCYTRPGTPTKVATFRDTDDADNLLRIILSFFRIYQEDGYLAHADNTTRNRLLKTIGFLLKVVPDDDPSLFVDDSVHALKALSGRNPEEAANMVAASLDLLFRSLKLPQRYQLGFEDVESFGRKTREHQQELLRLKLLVDTGRGDKKEYEKKALDAERDEKFLLRIQYIALSYLSNSERGENVPNFCSHVIQLGRHSHSEAVQVIATRSLGLQCLIRPETVCTFLPLILSDAFLFSPECSAESLPIAAIGVTFDLVMEYGLSFFKIRKTSAEYEADHRTNTLTNCSVGTEHGRVISTETVQSDDEHKVGNLYLQNTLVSFLHPSCPSVAAIAIVGCCKLLSANRLPKERVPTVLGFLLLHFCQFEADGKQIQRSTYMASFLDYFFRSYASSHFRRQADLIAGGVAVLDILLLHHAPLPVISKFIRFLLQTSDAFLLAHIREIDPDITKSIQWQAQVEENGGGSSRRSSFRGSSKFSVRCSATRSSMQSGRLRKELSRCSQHERVAEHLFFVLLDENLSTACKNIFIEALEKYMYLYNSEPQPLLCQLAQKVSSQSESEDVKQRVKLWLQEYLGRFQRPFLPMDEPQFSARIAQIQGSTNEVVKELIKGGALLFKLFSHDRETLKMTIELSNPLGGVQERTVGNKRMREDNDFSDDPLNLNSIFKSSTRKLQ